MSETNESLLRIERVSERVGFGRSEIYNRIKQGKFPEPIKLGRISVWVESDLDQWVAKTIHSKSAAQPSAFVHLCPQAAIHLLPQMLSHSGQK